MVQQKSYFQTLNHHLENFQSKMIELLDISTIVSRRLDYWGEFQIIGNPNEWREPDHIQKNLQVKLKKEYLNLYEHIKFITVNLPDHIQTEIQRIHESFIEWIDKSPNCSLPDSIEEAKQEFSENAKKLNELVGLPRETESTDYILIPDTNSLINCPDLSKYSSIVNTEVYTVILLPTVLEELDELKVKYKDADLKKKAESVIKRIKGYRTQGNMQEGVKVNKTINVKMVAQEPNFNNTLGWLDKTNNDDRIIASVIEIQRERPRDTLILVSSDINLQNKSEMALVPHEETPK